MNNSFDLKRFTLLIKRQWIISKNEYLLSLVVVLAILLFYYGFQVYFIIDFYDSFGTTIHNIQNIIFSGRVVLFSILGILFITLIASSYYKKLGKPQTAIPEILIPASQLEKKLTALVYTVIAAISAYLLIFYIADYSVVSVLKKYLIAHYSFTTSQQEVLNDNMHYYFDTIENDKLKYILFLPCLINAAFLLGSIYFNKNQFIKSAVSIAIYFFITVISIFFINNIFFSGLIHPNTEKPIDQNDIVSILSAMGWLLTVALWFIAYVRLKEKEV